MSASACIKFKIMIPRCANHSRARINLVTLIEFLTKILYSDGTEINRGIKRLYLLNLLREKCSPFKGIKIVKLFNISY